MSFLKRISAVLLSAILIVTLAVPAFAVNITIEDGNITGATYKAYRLLDATNAVEDGKGTDKFAYTVNPTYRDALIEALELDETATDAQIIDGIEAKRSEIQTFAQDLYPLVKDIEDTDSVSETTTNVFTNLEQGYYLIVETAIGNTPVGDDSKDVFSLIMLDTAGHEDIPVTTKEQSPILKKEITGDDNEIDGDIADNKLTDNVSVGSLVEYTVTATVPSQAAYYDYYYFIIGDTLSEGLTYFEDDTHKLTVGNGGEADLVLNTDYKLYTGEAAGDNTFQVALLDAKANAGKAITVTYWATLNENAVIGEEEGNKNTVNLSYSNNPNFDYNGTKNPDKPGFPKDDANAPLGETPKYVTRTYTTGIQLIKVDENGKSLTGAEFEIKGENLFKVLVVEKTDFVADENGDYWKLKDGTYTKQAPTDDRYEEITDGSRDGGYVLDGTEYKEATAEQLEDTSVKLYKFVAGNKDSYENTTAKYALKYTYEIVEESAAANSYTAGVDANGYLVVAGLGEGEYTITETKAPDGYNKIDAFKVKIEWAPAEAPNSDWSASIVDKENGNLTMNDQGLFEVTVVNQSGAELPSTGGMGTTLFYIVGGALALAAVVLLVTKKRMAAES